MKKPAHALLYFATLLALLCVSTPALIVALPACGASSVDCKDPANAKNLKCVPGEAATDVIDCAKAAVGPQALVDVTNALTGSDWTSAMIGVGEKYGIQIASCAARDVLAIWTAASHAHAPVATGSGSGSGAASPPATSQPRPEVLHAQTYLADKKFKE